MMNAAATGMVRVDKPTGPTSHDMVARARRALGIRRIGHTGTLDPFASGLLILCVGQATRLAEYLSDLDKRYAARAVLGQTTDTDDLEGEVLKVSEHWRDLTSTAVEQALAGFVGEIEQVPPVYSAKKVEGERMYRRARRGEVVVQKAVPVHIFDVRVTRVDLPVVDFELHCSSGTYVRALARDLGEALGVGAHLTELRRTAIGSFAVDGAVSGDDLHDMDRVLEAWLEPSEALAHLPSMGIDAGDAARIGHGQSISVGDSAPPPDVPVAVLHQGKLICVASRTGDQLRPRKVLV